MKKISYLIQYLYFRILLAVKPVIVFIGKIYPKLSSKEHIFKQYYNIESLVRPGDVILTKSDGHLSNLTNIGYWKHALICVSGERFKQDIVEAIGKGVVRRSLIEMLASKDRIIILRPTSKLIENKEQTQKSIEFVLNQVGKPYDYKFDSFTHSSTESFYCSELIYSSIKSANPSADFNLRSSFGIKTVTPMDLYNMVSKGKFEIIIEIDRKNL
jgi:uncharacterized protein YycO